ncbi:hypothetical protein FHR20_000161 [Sphingomonas leidyi]|uniref:Uncharacterized protein n=1 Tax=Sphingomonas leidyi TaxID=68569 RepID=A0A7X5UVV7_9SPHN|nr:hypothetical protein [Sphingomonas leidyi]NIJ63230.1 hypothetical protein [Sphingomonas leidyi]
MKSFLHSALPAGAMAVRAPAPGEEEGQDKRREAIDPIVSLRLAY